MKNILITDDHPLIRVGLRTILESMSIRVDISEAWNAKTVMERLKEKQFDLVLLDIHMPATDSVVLMYWIQSFYPATKILIISQNQEEIYGKRYLQLGANGYINKAVPEEETIKAVTRILDGGTYISDELSQSMLRSVINGMPANPFEQLSQREFQVVICLAKGYTMNEICDMLQVQYATAHTHKRRAFDKLNIEDHKHLLQLVDAYGLID